MKEKSLKFLKIFFQRCQFLISLSVILLPKGGSAVDDKLCVFERRLRMLSYITQFKYTTRMELAEEFNVSLATINRDMSYLSSIAPIYTKRGNGGGIYILPEYRSYKNYLSEAEETFLYNLMQRVEIEEKRILCGIITKFTKNPMQEYSSFQNLKQKGGN